MADYFQSVRRDGRDAVRVLRELDDVNVRNADGENLLHMAIAYSNGDAAVELIQRGIDVNAQDEKGMTPLHYAAAYRNVMGARQILAHGGNVEIADKHGNTPLWTAVFNARGNYEVVNALVERGAGKIAHIKNKHGRSPIDLATQIGDAVLVEMMSNRL